MKRFLMQEWRHERVDDSALKRVRERTWQQFEEAAALKAEWVTGQLPDGLLLRARNRAWGRLHAPSVGRGRLLLKPVIVTLVMVLLAAAALVVLRPGAAPPVLTAGPIQPLPLRPTAAWLLPETSGPPLPGTAPTDPVSEDIVPGRVVLQIRLPESGTRMIWIKDKDFDISGGLR